MASKLKDGMRTKTSTTTTTIRQEKPREVPKGATIIDKSVRTETEQIENGYLICKNYDITYETGSGENKQRGYAYYSKKWFSENDPLTITINDSSLADAFED